MNTKNTPKQTIDKNDFTIKSGLDMITYSSIIYAMLLSYTDNNCESTHSEYYIRDDGRIYISLCIDLGENYNNPDNIYTWSGFAKYISEHSYMIDKYSDKFTMVLGHNYGGKGGLEISQQAEDLPYLSTEILSREKIDNISWISKTSKFTDIYNDGSRSKIREYEQEVIGKTIDMLNDSKLPEVDNGQLQNTPKETKLQNHKSNTEKHIYNILSDDVWKDILLGFYGYDKDYMIEYNSEFAELSLEEISEYSTSCGNDKNKPFDDQTINYLKNHNINTIYAIVGSSDDNLIKSIEYILLPLEINLAEDFSKIIDDKGGSLFAEETQIPGWSAFSSE